MIRINQFLARRGISSRRGADELIAAGRVTVNGSSAQVGVEVDPRTDHVSVDGQPVNNAIEMLAFAFNKPMGLLTTRTDRHGRPTIFDVLPAVPGLCAIGRLDADSRGLLILTTDGDLAHRVAHPRFGVVKRYRVEVDTAVADAQIERLRSGVMLGDGPARAIAVDAVAPHKLEIRMGEGRKREVRRMCAAVGLNVVDLERVAVGPVELGTLPAGEFRPLTAAELQSIYHTVGLPWTANDIP